MRERINALIQGIEGTRRGRFNLDQVREPLAKPEEPKRKIDAAHLEEWLEAMKAANMRKGNVEEAAAYGFTAHALKMGLFDEKEAAE